MNKYKKITKNKEGEKMVEAIAKQTNGVVAILPA